MAEPRTKELNPDASILGPRAARLARGPDISQLRQPIKTSVSGTRQVIHALETATGEVKKFLLDEINLMYECKTCHSVFRSLANLISHKRTFCKTKYDEVLHMYQDKEGSEATNMKTVVIQAEPVECVEMAQCDLDLSGYSPSLELMSTAGLLEDMQARRRGLKGVGPPTNRLLPPGKVPLASVVEGLKEKLDGAQDFMSKMKKNYEVPQPQSTMHLEPMYDTKAAFQQSWRYSEGGETVGQTYRAWQQAEEDNRKIRVGPGGEVMTNEATVKLVTGPDGHTYSVRVPLDDDIKGASFCETEEGGNLKYPCPHCKRTFLQVKKVMSHMVSVHDESMEEAKKLKSSIKKSGTVAEPKAKTVRVNDTNCKPVKPVQVKVQNLTLTLNGKMNLCEQLSTDQSVVCPIMKTRISDSTKADSKDAEAAEKVNEFVSKRQSEDMPVEVEAKVMESVNRRRVQCKICDKKFTSSLLLRSHVAGVHLDLQRFRCKLCEYGCWTKQACHEHIATKHRLNDVASAAIEQPMKVYFKEHLPEPEVLDISDTDDKEAKTVENGAEHQEEPVEEPEEEPRCIVGVIINENNGSNGLPTPEAVSGGESEGEEVSELAVGSSQSGRSPRGRSPRGRPAGGRSPRGRPSGKRGRKKGGNSGRSSNSSSNGNEGKGAKRSRGPSLESEDEEVTLNMPPAGKVARLVEELGTSEDTLPDLGPDPLFDVEKETPSPSVPKLLIKFAGPNNTSPTVNKVGRGGQQKADITNSPFKVPPERTSERARSRSKDTRPPPSPSPPPSRDSSGSRASSRSSSKSSPRTSSDLDSPKKEMKVQR